MAVPVNWSQVESLRADGSPGEAAGLNDLVPLLYEQLRHIARHRLRGSPDERSLNTTGLVHEAYLRLAENSALPALDHEHLLAIASRVMRNVLVDQARARSAHKRGGGVAPLALVEGSAAAALPLDGVTELHEALERLALIDQRQSRLVELHYFGGLSLDETATVMELSVATVKRDLRLARAWLAATLRDGTP